MECDDNGRDRGAPVASGSRRVQWQRLGGGGRGLQLAFPSATCGTRPGCPPFSVGLSPPTTTTTVSFHPFMNNMDEISYWVYTKRAPCLFNYDNILKKQVEQAHCSKTTPASGQSIIGEVPSPKKKKRKLKLMDDDSVSTEKPQNVYFETSQKQNQKTAPISCKSGTLGSNIDFNITKSSVQNKSKRIKLQRNHQTTKKKRKVVTSTPKVTNLRRSLRRAQQQNVNGDLNSSFEIFNAGDVNGEEEIGLQQQTKSEKLPGGDQNKSKDTLPEQADKDLAHNGQFEDMSDVSGFTANYIRSTKIHSSKTPRKLRNRNSRTLVKDSNDNGQPEEKMIVCMNKSVNTGLPEPNVLNCSTDSSQNVINLVTIKNNDRTAKVNRSTSLLKFMNPKLDNTKGSIPNNKVDTRVNKTQLNLSFQSKSSGTSRYPKRCKNHTRVSNEDNNHKSSPRLRFSERINKLDDSDRKENSEERIITRTRSRKKMLNLEHDQSNTMLELNNTNDQLSSCVALNVANPSHNQGNTSTSRCLRSRRCKDKGFVYKDSVSESDSQVPDGTYSPLVKSTSRCLGQVKKSMDKTGQSLGKDSMRNRSGFAACFSDSGSDNEPLKQRKFFC